MTELTVLLPEWRRAAMSPVVCSWVARGDRLPDLARGRDAALRACFEFVAPTMPAAALTRTLDANDAAAALWLRADPCHVVADVGAVRMLGWGRLGLSDEESAELVRALRPLFGDAGFPLEAANAERWYLRCPRGTRLPRFADPGDVLGADLLPHFPRGDNERQWRHLLNEAQVILHNHDVNMRRAQRGQATANSVWFWGAGPLPDWVRTPFTQVFSDDAVVEALARQADVAVQATTTFSAASSMRGARLLDLAHEHRLDRALAPIAVTAQITALTLSFESGETILYKRRHRWRFWRRVRKGLS